MDLGHNINSIILLLRQADAPERYDSAIKSSAFYLPAITNPENVTLLITEVLWSPNYLAPLRADTDCLSQANLLLQSLLYAANKKAVVSSPTISPADWRSHVILACLQLDDSNCWRAIPVLAGLCLSDLKDLKASSLLVKFVNTTLSHYFAGPVSRLAAFSVAAAYRHVSLSDLQNSCALLLSQILFNSIYDIRPLVTKESNPSRDAVAAQLGPLSGALGAMLKAYNDADFDAFDVLLNTLTSCATDIMPRDSISEYHKRCLFAYLNTLTGLLERLLLTPKFPASYFGGKILTCIQPLSLAIYSIGPLSLQQYQFIYSSSLDMLSMDVKESEITTRVLAGGCNWFDASVVSPSEAAKVNFVLDVFEELMPTYTLSFRQQFVLPLIDLNLESDNKKVMESAHAAILAYLLLSIKAASSGLDYKQHTENVVSMYLDSILRLFPEKLSYGQFALAFTSIVQTSCPPLFSDWTFYNKVMERIYIECERLAELPPIPIAVKQEADNRPSPPEVKSALVASLAGALPYADPAAFKYWIDRIWIQCRGLAPHQKFCEEQLWNTVSNLDVSLADYGIHWVYNHSSL